MKATGFNTKDIIVFEPSTAAAETLKNTYSINVAATNTDAVLFKPRSDNV